MFHSRVGSFTKLSLALLLSAGCSGRVARYPVTGTIRFDDGQPVRIGVVEFRCPQSGVSARSKLDDRGMYQLGTFADADGAPVGDYQVIIVQYFNVPPTGHVHSQGEEDADEQHQNASHDDPAHNHDPHPDARVAAKFGNYSTSPLRAAVRADGENRFDFVVTHPAQPLRE
jgi:hypothetical protein